MDIRAKKSGVFVGGLVEAGAEVGHRGSGLGCCLCLRAYTAYVQREGMGDALTIGGSVL